MYTLLLLSLIFVAARAEYKTLHAVDGRETIVQMFEWKWTDIAHECETFLPYYGYGAIQTSPPMEHIVLNQNGDRPWWIRYQPVSYKLESRSGSETQFQDMVRRCNAAGVRVIADTVLNHMVGVGQKYGQNGKWSSHGTNYDGTDGVESFPGVPFSNLDFNDKYCHHDIHNYNDANEVRNCRLVGLLDLHQGSDYVRGKMAEYTDRMVKYGVAGFRLDASKHMWPGDIKAILDRTQNLNSDIGSNARPFVVQEVIDMGGEAVHGSDYTNNGRITNFKYGRDLSSAVRRQKNFADLKNFGEGWGYWAGGDVVVFVEDHDNERDNGHLVLNYKDGEQYKMAVGFMLAWDYGIPRVLSSYYFNSHDQGPPSSGSPNYHTRSPTYNSDQTCNANSGWVCEHRWPAIRNMAYFRAVTSGASVGNIVTDDNRLAFSRSGKGWCAVNNGYGDWSVNFETTLPSGTYCDVYDGALSNGRCTGQQIHVDGSGRANINVPSGKLRAIHLKSKIGSGGGGKTTVAPFSTLRPTSVKPPVGYKQTAILVKKNTKVGQNVFIRGGVDTNHRDNCVSDADRDPCAIGIRHKTVVPASFESYKDWSRGDLHLDWYGAEAGQGTYNGIKAAGTPLAWSTNDPNTLGYQPLNKYGPGYWIALVDMDCSQSYDGWFELKTYEAGGEGWESDISQNNCGGTAGGEKPYSSKNHFGRCGYVNVFEFGNDDCTINNF